MATLATGKLSEQFEEFLKTLTDKNGEYLYRSRISQLTASGGKSLLVDYEDLIRYNDELAKKLLEEPDKTLESFRTAAFETLRSENPRYADHVGRALAVRIRGIPDRVALRKVDTSYIDRMIAVSGMVVRTSELRPLMTEAAFVCDKGDLTYQTQDDMLLKKPTMCETCDSRNLELDKKHSRFIDYQILRVQELPEELPPGQLPQFFDVNAEGDIVNTARPGDRVILTGTIRAVPDYSPGQGRMRLFKSQIDCNYVEVIGKEPEQIQITKEDEAIIRSIPTSPDAYQKLASSIAPAILGHEPEREAILLLLAGGAATLLPDGTKLRGDVNVLFVGDPGTAKSEMLKFAAQVAPRGLFASGRGTTSAGLSAAVIREKNVLMLEAGVVVLADQGVAAIDEFDKMRPEDRGALHEQMEQQSYHPSMEVLLADGTRQEIGPLVSQLMKRHAGELTKGVDCEVLPLKEQVEVYSFELGPNRVHRARIGRVSRHVAPDSFVELLYSNGRKILVTPEHPVFVFRDEEIGTVPAERITKGEFVPSPRFIPNSSAVVQLESIPERSVSRGKEVSLKSSLTLELARILGYLLTEGHFYAGSSYEVGFTNSDSNLLDEFRSLMLREFHIVPTIQEKPGGVCLRYISKQLYGWLEQNFPEIVHHARSKRTPAKIMGASQAHIREFLRSAFLGDGSVESTAICFRTASQRMCEDYQDLLLKLGISSRIVRDRANDSFKVYIRGDSLALFTENLVEGIDPRIEKIRGFVRRSTESPRGHDVVPPSVARTIMRLLRELKLLQSEYFWPHMQRSYGVNLFVLERFLEAIRRRLRTIESLVSESWPSLRDARARTGLSQHALGKIAGLARGEIDYLERGGHAKDASRRLSQIRMRLDEYAVRTKKVVEQIQSLENFRFLRVVDVKRVPNEGSVRTDWVYDVTVEPTQNFVSKGLLLHNTVTIAKGGIYATLNARTAILAATNPVLGKYNPFQNLTENINLPIPLLTRFDLIFVIKDTPTPAEDERLASHILAVHRKRGYNVPPPIEFSLLKKYIAYAKKITPILTKEAEDRIKDFYLDLRRRTGPDQIGATPRTLESLIRLATARARIMLREQVTEEDALNAISLMNKMVEDVLTDQETKTRVDFGVLLGRPAGERGKLGIAIEILKRLEGTERRPVERKVFKDELMKTTKFADDEDAEKTIKTMFKEGLIYESKTGFFRRVGS